MKTRFCFLLVTLLVGPAAALIAQKSTSDILPPPRRQASVDKATFLSRPPAPAPVPADLPQPFNPADFDAPEPGEFKSGMGASPSSNRPGGGSAPSPSAAPVPVGPSSDRDVIDMLAAQIRPSGMLQLRGTPRLIISNKPFEVGTRFTVTYNGQDYELELTAIDRTTFTLRYRNEETTRPITPTK